MPALDLLNQNNEKIGSVQVSDTVFFSEVNISLVHQVIKAQLANKRQGTAKTKTKAEVRGGGRKPFRQKGTGNARQGSIRSPLQPGGGQTFGPQPRSYEQRTPKKMIQGALRSVLSDRVKAQRIIILNELNLPDLKTKGLDKIVKEKFKLKNVLIVDEKNENLELASRNIPEVSVIRSDGLNVYDIVRHDWLLMTEKAVRVAEKQLEMPDVPISA